MRNSVADGTIFDRLAVSVSVQPNGGVPSVADLPSDLIQQFGEPYMQRHFLLGHQDHRSQQARYHHIL